ncbi:hypothetical protein [Alkalibacillus haloalkaliphilus]|uniref:hypothetical protein n=1 Tax=Alkalibacillus haloalkaliphilus TaxID=94136 RepID=UPI002935A7C9|nr:hypothetical protein [Alkalibacillus haloalkaliphilus]MDV2582367.1 hypothetical protein [Alkalibacillus haloalkaliphilus]
MKIKEYALAILLYAFLGYLLTIFISHLVNFANTINNTLLVGGVVIFVGVILFGEITRRIAPFNQYKFSHPLKITCVASFILTVGVVLTAFSPL